MKRRVNFSLHVNIVVKAKIEFLSISGYVKISQKIVVIHNTVVINKWYPNITNQNQ